MGRSVLHGRGGWMDGGKRFWWDMEISASAVLFNLHNYFYFPMFYGCIGGGKYMRRKTEKARNMWDDSFNLSPCRIYISQMPL